MLHIDLNPHDLAEVTRILELHAPELEVWAFGSRVKWTAKAHSDLDLALITNSPLPLDRFAELREAFDESQLPIRVDLVDWARTSETFREIISQQKIVVKSASAADEKNIHWPVVTLEAALEALIDYRGKTPEKTTSGIPLVTAKVIKNGRIERPTEFIAIDSYDTWMRRGIPKPGDIVLTTEAPLGEVAQLGKEKVALAQRVITLRGKPGVLDNGYLLYLLQTEDMQEQLRSRATGTTVLGIKQSELRKITIRIPPVDVQQNAANILRALDDRITLLRENNVTLDGITQALFKSWFVDFEPVRARQEGREPGGMDEVTAALFSDGFEESKLGLIPKGWRIGDLGENTSYLNRGISPKYLEKGGVLVINQKCIRNFILDLSKARRHDPAQRKIDGRELYVGDILVNSTGVGTLGRIAQVLTTDELMIVDSHVTVVRGNTNLTWNYLGLSLMRRQGEIEGLGEGSTGQTELSRGKLLALKLVIPPMEILIAFDEVTLPLRKRFSANLKQANTLATVRDTVLPRLISGQLRLPHAIAQTSDEMTV